MIFELIRERNVNNMAKPAVCTMKDDGTLCVTTYSQLFEGIARYSEILKAAGYHKGDRIGICGAPCPEWHMAFYAISQLGCVCVAIDHAYTHDELLQTAQKAMLRGIYLTDNTFSVLDNELDGVNIYRLEDGSLRRGVPYIGETEYVDTSAEILIFSSGTTSAASGILHKGENAVASVELILHENKVDNEKQRFLAFLPNNHIYGCYSQCIAPALHGCSVCYMESMTARCITEIFKQYKPTIFCGVPQVYELLYMIITRKIQADPKKNKLFNRLLPLCISMRQKTGINLGKLLFKEINDGIGGCADALVCGGAPLDKKISEFFYAIGARPIITYGATETSIPSIGNYGRNITAGTCGKPYPGVKIKIDDDGELLIKTPYQMIGYFADPVRTAEAYTSDGWFKSGDLAKLDKNGNVLIVGRRKENIVLSSGKKVAPDDIEKSYTGILGVRDFTVCGIPVNDIGGSDEVHCFVVPESEEDTESVIKAFKKRSAGLPLIMRLTKIHAIHEIPRTALGKPKRYQLRDFIKNKEGRKNDGH